MRQTLRFPCAVLILCLLFFASHILLAQNQVFIPTVDIDQQKLLAGCLIATDSTCSYLLKDVLSSGGHFWTTPFQPYDPTRPAGEQGDGYGEGIDGPRADQRHV